MSANIQNVFKFICILQTRKRVSVRTMADELSISRSAMYRWIDSASSVLPIRLENGIIVLKSSNLED